MRFPARFTDALYRHLMRRVAQTRGPDFVIGGHERPYLLRWYVIPRNRWFNIYLHNIRRSDDDRAEHSHPWLFNCSVLLDGCYVEHSAAGPKYAEDGAVKARWGASFHRLQLIPSLATLEERPVWTLFITGPKVREWGFACPQGWRHWREFTSPRDGGSVGRGCE